MRHDSLRPVQNRSRNRNRPDVRIHPRTEPDVRHRISQNGNAADEFRFCYHEVKQNVCKGAFTLARFRGRFRTKLACLEMKFFFICSKTCKLSVKSCAKFASVNAPLVSILYSFWWVFNQFWTILFLLISLSLVMMTFWSVLISIDPSWSVLMSLICF